MVTAHEYWPTPASTLLLRAGLASGDVAIAAYREWTRRRPDVEAQTLGAPERRLLPLVHDNLTRLGVADAFLAQLVPIVERSRHRSARLVSLAATVSATLQGAGVAVMALKGVPLVRGYYADPALRPMSDIDLMVAPRHLATALSALAADGWRVEPHPAGLVPYLCAFELAQADGKRELDLHQYLIEYGSTPDLEAGLWQRARPLDLGAVTALQPSPTDMLLHVLIASLKAGSQINSRWVADASIIVERAVIDWDLFVREAQRRKISLAIGECLTRLVDIVPVPIPAEVPAALARVAVGAAERLTYRVLTRYPRSLPQLASDYAVRYRFGALAAGQRPGVLDFMRYCALVVQDKWGLASPWSLVPTALVRGRDKLRRRASRG